MTPDKSPFSPETVIKRDEIERYYANGREFIRDDEIRAELLPGESLVQRYSPGYGDFPLECQPGLFRLLGVQRNIGVTLTDSLLMLPTKSVTAVIGISDAALPCPAGCAACDRRDCAFRDDRKDKP